MGPGPLQRGRGTSSARFGARGRDLFSVDNFVGPGLSTPLPTDAGSSTHGPRHGAPSRALSVPGAHLTQEDGVRRVEPTDRCRNGNATIRPRTTARWKTLCRGTGACSPLPTGGFARRNAGPARGEHLCRRRAAFGCRTTGDRPDPLDTEVMAPGPSLFVSPRHVLGWPQAAPTASPAALRPARARRRRGRRPATWSGAPPHLTVPTCRGRPF